MKSKYFLKTYVGSTTNLDRRLGEHNAGKSVFSSRYAPWILLYKEEHGDLATARKREKYFKSSAGRRRIKEILQNYIPR